ncbi:MAG: dihydropteroate synthase [Bacteroidia bacterium]|nr:dihydropteroate synthase [Sphingobacteriaceae bacterium]MBP9070158.1 dihydropteroate synthase [Bacteroidia bacterium]
MVYQANQKTLNFEQPLIMAIVNLTPDSFYDGGKYDSVKDVLADVSQKIKAGAHIIDIGAASSRPGAKEISELEEWERLEKPLEAIRKEFPNIIISVDTYRSSIAKKSADLGADMINDIAAGDKDPKMFETMAALDIPYVLMHMKGDPEHMQKDPVYSDVVAEVKNELKAKIQKLESLGIKKLIIDPGFGFGKNTEHNFKLLKHLPELSSLTYPILVGVSRKSMVNKVINTSPVTALNGTTVLHTIALLNGAKMLRVHDVSEAKQAIELVQYYKNV